MDRNRCKGLCEGKAKEQGIATAKLPIAEHANLVGNKVLTVNQVFEMLSEYMVRPLGSLSTCHIRIVGPLFIKVIQSTCL